VILMAPVASTFLVGVVNPIWEEGVTETQLSSQAQSKLRSRACLGSKPQAAGQASAGM
jgi:hypothetical protein